MRGLTSSIHSLIDGFILSKLMEGRKSHRRWDLTGGSGLSGGFLENDIASSSTLLLPGHHKESNLSSCTFLLPYFCHN